MDNGGITPVMPIGNNGYGDFVGSTSTGSGVWNRFWSEDGNFSNCVAFQANEAFVYTCAGNIDPNKDHIIINTEDVAKWGDPLFQYGLNANNPRTEIVDAGPYAKMFFDQSNMVVFYDRHGK